MARKKERQKDGLVRKKDRLARMKERMNGGLVSQEERKMDQ